jgi:hypothetical protein
MILSIIIILVFVGGFFSIYYAHVFFLYAVLIAFSQPLSLMVRLLAWIRWLYFMNSFLFYRKIEYGFTVILSR